MSKRKLYPPGREDRLILWGGWIIAAIIYLLVQISAGFNWFDLIAVLFANLAMYVVMYFKQDPTYDELEEYTVVIANIEGISRQLSDLDTFLKRERGRVAESEATLARLQNEKTQLEPVVLAQRETVNAVLAAFTATKASRARKERVLGFMMGVLASLVAAIVFEFFRRRFR